MSWFSYSYTRELGHHFDGPVPEQHRRAAADIMNRAAPYGRLPDEIPYVGHFEIGAGLWLVLAKPAGSGTFYGRTIPGEDYSAMGYSPYQLVVAYPPPKLVLGEVGEPLRQVEVISATDSARYLSFAARIFEGLAGSDRRRTHHSIAVKEDVGEGATFVFKEGIGEKSLELIEEENRRPILPAPAPPVDVGALLGDISALRYRLRTLCDRLDEATRPGSDNEALAGLRRELRALRDELAEGNRTASSETQAILERITDRFESRWRKMSASSERGPKRLWLAAGVGAVGLSLGAIVVFLSLNAFRSDTIEQSIAGIKDDLGAQKPSLEDLKTRSDTIEQSIAGIKDDLGAQKPSLEDLKTRSDTIVQRIAGIKDDLDAQKPSLEDLKTRGDTIEQRIAGIKDDLDAQKPSLEDLKTRGDTIEQRIAGIKDDLDAQKPSLEDLKTRSDTIEQRITGIQKDLGTLKVALGAQKLTRGNGGQDARSTDDNPAVDAPAR